MLTDRLNTKEISTVNSLLTDIWGDESPIASVQNPITREEAATFILNGNLEAITGNTIIYFYKQNNEICGCIGLKLVDNQTVEIGSIALHPCLRGMGISSRLYDLIRGDLTDLINSGIQKVVSYATVGSPVLCKITPSIQECLGKNFKILPTNLAPYIIPTKQTFITEPFVKRRDGISSTSTIELVSLKKDGTHKLPEIDQLKPLLRLYKGYLPSKSTFLQQNYIVGLPINMDIAIFQDPETNFSNFLNLNKASKPAQIRVPLTQEHRKLIIDLLENRFLCTGITISDNQTYVCFFSKWDESVNDMLKRLAYMEIPIIPTFANALMAINNR